MELDKIIVKYGADVSELKKDLGEIKNSTKGVEDAAKSLGDNVSTKLNSAFKTLGTTIAAAFAVEKIGSFISSSIQLAAEAEEIKRAFDRLNSPTLLTNLRTATEGTLSDLKLMGVALRADKLQVPLEKLGKILQFAKLRADELGKSTEELADTLLQGIGTKGTRALVQVGISQEQFSAEVKKTGDYFEALDNIMTETLSNAGQGFESVADKQDKLRASIENTKVEIGEQLLPVLDKLLTAINNVASGFGYLFNASDKHWKGGYESALEFADKTNMALSDVQAQVEIYTDRLEEARKKQEEVNDKFFGTPAQRRSANITVKTIEGGLQAYKDLVVQLTNASNREKDLTEETKTLGKETKETTTQVWALGQALLGWVSLVETTKGVETATIDTDKLADAMLRAKNELDGLIKLTPALSTTTSDTLEKATLEWDDYAHAILSIFDSFNTAATNSSNYQLATLEKQLADGIISEEKYDRRKRDILRGEANREKAFSLLSITLSTARAIMNALGSVPPNPALAAIAGITGAVQLGVAAAAPIPAFAKGGLVEGKEQLIRINERGEEYVINATATRKHRDLLDAINKDKFDQYMANKYGGKDTAVSWDDYRLLLAMQKDTYVSKENTAKIVQAIKEQRKAHRF